MKQNEAFLLEQQALLDAFPLPVFISDSQQVFIAGNKAFYAFIDPQVEWNPDPEELHSENFHIDELHVPDKHYHPLEIETLLQSTISHSGFPALDTQVLETGTARTIELSLRRADGVDCQVLLSKTRFHNPLGFARPCILNTIQDISEQYQAQNTLLDAIDSIAEAFVIYDNDGKLVICNQNFREMYGYSEEQARPGVHFQELGRIDISNGNVAIGDEAGEDFLERKAAYRRELKGSFTVKLRDGRWIQTTDRRVPGLGFVSVQSDITTSKESEYELLRAKETAELASRAKSEFLANMSHELRTPLNSMIGFSHILMAEMFGKHTSPKYTEYAEAIHRSSNLLLELLSDILDQSKIELGNAILEPEAVQISPLLNDCLSLLRERSDRAGIELILQSNPDLPEISLDRLKTKQTILNLLTNAIKFTDAGGEVIVSAGLGNQGGLQIRVQDSGIGIAAENLSRVLEPFAQVAESKTRNHEGSGLGLSIARSFVELHGGVLSIESTLGQGTVVVLDFPSSLTLAHPGIMSQAG
ncbi:ATP-binding protein [Kiloniella laminariae]|uniref:histidine kinase n=1 Tax=Kiloniella laminariae TaxID=454162 RepID=A0ABT4LPA9_9PROT|nr:ATP-binding protein [Kiloniella laminariae]MCZ4282914.1 ATP-binding protein [Kiloniella laminariae]